MTTRQLSQADATEITKQSLNANLSFRVTIFWRELLETVTELPEYLADKECCLYLTSTDLSEINANN